MDLRRSCALLGTAGDLPSFCVCRCWWLRRFRSIPRVWISLIFTTFALLLTESPLLSFAQLGSESDSMVSMVASTGNSRHHGKKVFSSWDLNPLVILPGARVTNSRQSMAQQEYMQNTQNSSNCLQPKCLAKEPVLPSPNSAVRFNDQISSHCFFHAGEFTIHDWCQVASVMHTSCGNRLKPLFSHHKQCGSVLCQDWQARNGQNGAATSWQCRCVVKSCFKIFLRENLCLRQEDGARRISPKLAAPFEETWGCQVTCKLCIKLCFARCFFCPQSTSIGRIRTPTRCIHCMQIVKPNIRQRGVRFSTVCVYIAHSLCAAKVMQP